VEQRKVGEKAEGKTKLEREEAFRLKDWRSGALSAWVYLELSFH